MSEKSKNIQKVTENHNSNLRSLLYDGRGQASHTMTRKDKSNDLSDMKNSIDEKDEKNTSNIHDQRSLLNDDRGQASHTMTRCDLVYEKSIISSGKRRRQRKMRNIRRKQQEKSLEYKTTQIKNQKSSLTEKHKYVMEKINDLERIL